MTSKIQNEVKNIKNIQSSLIELWESKPNFTLSISWNHEMHKSQQERKKGRKKERKNNYWISIIY